VLYFALILTVNSLIILMETPILLTVARLYCVAPWCVFTNMLHLYKHMQVQTKTLLPHHRKILLLSQHVKVYILQYSNTTLNVGLTL
jgi:hypothetical protein